MPLSSGDLLALPTLSVVEGWRVGTAGAQSSYSRLDSRFMPAGDPETGVFYLASSDEAALAEYFGGQHVVGASAFVGKVLARLYLNREFRVVDLSQASALAALGLRSGDLTASSYQLTQELATSLLYAGYDGVAVESPQSSDGRMYALFGRLGLLLWEKVMVEERPLVPGDAAMVGVKLAGPIGGALG